MNPNPPRKDVARTAVLLCLATGALVAFILGLGDFRRQRNALAQLRWHSNNYDRRVGAGGMMPLNFDPDVPPEGQRNMIPLQWLDRTSAAKLRGVDRPVMVAQTIPILQVFGYDGRAVMTFKGGKFTVEWLTLPQFETLWAAQKKLVDRPAADKAVDAPTGP